MKKLYTGQECFDLFKEMYYQYCDYSIETLTRKIKLLYPEMEYANDFIGVQIKTISILIYMKKHMRNKTDNWENNFWFNVFIKKEILNDEILNRNGIY